MARPVRIDVAGGWYHITARGIERRVIFTEARECRHFLDVVGAMTERYGVEVHAYVLMGNHYHLLMRTPKANASRAIQWLNVSYSVWFNRRRDRVGHVFQGRFGSVLIDGDGGWLLQSSGYLHLNPVRVQRLGLGKAGRKAEGRGYVEASDEQVQARLATLRGHRWSSFGAYAGYSEGPGWLVQGEILRRAGGREKYRRWVESYVRQGGVESEFEGLKARVMIGTADFVRQARRRLKRVSREQPDRHRVQAVVAFEQIVGVVERERGARWNAFADEYGDWGRDLALYLARKRSGLSLREIGERAGGLEYKTVSKAVTRMEARLSRDRKLSALLSRCLHQLSIVET